MHVSFSFHHSILQLSYTTQAWISQFKTCAMQAKHMKCTFKCTLQVHELAPPTCVLKSLIDHISLFLCQILPLSLISLILSPFVVFSLSLYTISPPLSSMTTKVQKCRQVEIINVNQWGDDHFPKYGRIQIICQRYLTRFDLRTSFFTPPNKGYLVPC